MRHISTDKIFVSFQCRWPDCFSMPTPPVERVSLSDIIAVGTPICRHCNEECDRIPEKAEVED